MDIIYSQIYIHLIIAVQNTDCIISKAWKQELYQSIKVNVRKNTHKVLAINGMPDHIHILVEMRPTQSLLELMNRIKDSSTEWINENKLVKGNFSWQEGYGAFSTDKYHLAEQIEQIINQEEYHKNKRFIEEYREILKRFKVEYEEEDLFHEVEYDEEV